MRVMIYCLSLLTLLFSSSCTKKSEVKTPDTGSKIYTYYVDGSNGNNNNDGLAVNKSFQTIAKALEMAQPQDTIFVRGGIYNVTVTLSKKNITLKNYANETPVIDGTGLSGNYLTLLTVGGSNNAVMGFEVRNSNLSAAKGTYSGGGRGVYITGQYNTVSHLKIHHTFLHGLQVQGDNNKVEDCEVYQSCFTNQTTTVPGIFGSKGGWPCALWVGDNSVVPSSNTVRRCKAYNNYGEGIMVFHANKTTIEDNVAYDNFSVSFYISDATNTLFQRNIGYHTSGTTWPTFNSSNLTLADETSNGTTVPFSADNTVINNFFLNGRVELFSWTLVNGTGLWNVLFANNTVVNGKISTGFGGNINITNKNSQVKNNIVVGTGVDVPNVTGLALSNNLWSVAPVANARSSSDIVGDPMLALSGSTAAGELSANYFKLTPSSPAINKGVNIAAVSQDFFRNNRDAQTDMGGHEFK